ncbi:MAG: hypothetical protein ACT4NV_05080 [Rhodoferax sp.]
MTTDTLDYLPGDLVRVRGRDWVVQADNYAAALLLRDGLCAQWFTTFFPGD